MPFRQVDSFSLGRDLGDIEPIAIVTARVGPKTFAFTANYGPPSYGVSSFGIVGNGAIDPIRRYDEPGDLAGYHFRNPYLATLEKGGESYLYVRASTDIPGGRRFGSDGLTVLRVGSDGELTVVQHLAVAGLGTPQIGYDSSPPAAVRVGGSDYLIAPGQGTERIVSLAIAGDGSLSTLDSFDTGNRFSGDYRMVVGKVGDRAFAVYNPMTPSTNGGLRVLEVRADGSLTEVFALPTDDPLLGAGASSLPIAAKVGLLHAADVGGKSFVFATGLRPVPSPGASSTTAISVFELGADGSLTPRGRTLAGPDDAWANRFGVIHSLDSFEFGGRSYLAVSSTAGIGIFAISATGALTEVAEHAPTPLATGQYELVPIVMRGQLLLLDADWNADRLRTLKVTGLDADPGRKGTGKDDILAGTARGDKLEGKDGDDLIDGRGGNDRISGGTGHDNLFGGDGKDTIRGDEGEDWLWGGGAADKLDGGLGIDFVHGEGGNDRLLGGDGDDVVSGGDGDDVVSGGAGNDLLRGDAGDDRLDGGMGNDVIHDGDGRDRLLGSAGADRFVFAKDGARDAVHDFEVDLDRIDLTTFGPMRFLDLDLKNAGRGVEVGVAGEILVIEAARGGLRAGRLDDADFIFA